MSGAGLGTRMRALAAMLFAASPPPQQRKAIDDKAKAHQPWPGWAGCGPIQAPDAPPYPGRFSGVAAQRRAARKARNVRRHRAGR